MSEEHKSFPMQLLFEHVRSMMPSVMPMATPDDVMLDEASTRRIWRRNQSMNEGKAKAIWDEKDKCCYCFFYVKRSARRRSPSTALRLKVDQQPRTTVLQFLKEFMAVIDNDTAVLSSLTHTWEDTWRALRATQMQRAIGHSSGHKAHVSNDWISMMEQASTLTYEGNPSKVIVVIPKNVGKFRESVGTLAMISLRTPLPLKEALFKEKWVRAVVDGDRVALVANKGDGGHISGFLSLTVLPQKDDSYPYSPHESLRLLQAHISTSSIILLNAPNGDLYVIGGRGIFWRKHQGRWRIVDCEFIADAMRPFVQSTEIARDVTRMCLDLSFERKGALICLVDISRLDLQKLIVDHASKERVNAPLRKALGSMEISNWGHRQVITAAAGTDGALVLDPSGKVLDVACMIADPPLDRVEAAGFATPKSFPGARSRAAWNASLFGLAIKVSEDGPITVLSAGKEICQIG